MFKAGRVGKLVHDLVNLIEVLDIVIAILKGGGGVFMMYYGRLYLYSCAILKLNICRFL